MGRGEARVQHEPGPEGIDLAEGARAEQDKRRHLLRRRATFYAGPAGHVCAVALSSSVRFLSYRCVFFHSLRLARNQTNNLQCDQSVNLAANYDAPYSLGLLNNCQVI